MKISKLQSFNEISKPASTGPVKQPEPMPQPESKALDLNKMPNSNSYLVGFKGKDDIEKYIGAKEMRIEDIVSIDKDIHIALKDMPEGKKHLNADGLNVTKKVGAETTQYVVSNDHKKELFIATIKKGAKPPVLTYKQGKFMPEVTVKHPSLGESRIKMLAGSKIISKDFSLIMPGEIYESDGEVSTIKKQNGISFKGNLAISTLNLESRTQNAVDLYMNSDLPQQMTKGAFVEDIETHKPFVAIPAGGFGERIFNLTRENENKPSYFLPTTDKCRIIGTSLNMAASAGIIQGNGEDNITYLSQNHSIEGDNVVHTNKYKTDGGAISEAIHKGIIPEDKDLIILNADIFTNADITRTYHALKTLPDAALVIPYYPVDGNRAKSFGLLGYEKDQNGNIQIKDFVEKSPYTTTPPVSPQPAEFGSDEEYSSAMDKYIENMDKFNAVQTAKDPKTGMFYSNPGIYVMSKEAVDVLKEMKDKAGLGGDVMPEIVRLCNEGKLLNSEGKPMKVYTLPLERADGKPAFWDDIGTAEAYLKVIKDVAYETEEKGTGKENKFYGVPTFILNDFRSNVDIDTSIVYQSKKARNNFESFKTAMNVTDAIGNMFIAE